MLEKIVDLHVHSKYSRACSKSLELPNIAEACAKKGIDIIATGDFTHPIWFKHLEDVLVEENKGLYKLKNSDFKVRFILGTEISCIYKHKDATRRLHLLILAPNLAAVKKFNETLEARGVNLKADGRPIMGIHAKEIVRIALEVDPGFMIIPAHAWTPWFAVFGSKSGYDTLEDCFEELTPHIRAIETGLSSDPTMNHRLSRLDGITLISNSDAHSVENLAREANVLGFESEKEITYTEITRIIKEGDRKKFLYTIEFYPEEGKYHMDGHADCTVCLKPEASKKEKNSCPVCKKQLTIGVLHRVDDLADRTEESIPNEQFIPHRYIVPLREIIGQVFDVGVASKKVKAEYEKMVATIGSEFYILLHATNQELEKNISDTRIAVAIENMRNGKVKVHPGYDGIFGTVDVLFDAKDGLAQSRLFN
jgi:uncharacterized protein (TIGR00375 family)